MVIADLVEQGFVLPITSGLWAYSGQGLKRVLPSQTRQAPAKLRVLQG